MKESINLIFTIQDYELKKQELERELLILLEQERLIELENSKQEKLLSESGNALKMAQNKIKQLERDILEAENTNVKYKTQQLSAKNSEDYRLFETMIEENRIKLLKLENDFLGQLYDLEKEEEKHKDLSHSVGNVAIALKSQQENLVVKKQEIQKRILEISRKTDALRKLVPDQNLVASYDRIQKSVKKFPIVIRYKNDYCGGCNVKFSGEILSKIRDLRDDFILCETCGRMIYVPSVEIELEDDDDNFVVQKFKK